MKDGVRLAATYFLPKPRSTGERFPVLLELLPYRKDDSFYLRDYPLYAYLARHGFACVKVDIRGTGVVGRRRCPIASTRSRSWTTRVEVIDQLAALPWSNGNVGMWGISWGGFNAIQVAMRQPPALKAILAAHASDNVYHDSVDFLDGAFHVDSYHLQIHHENGLPKPPDYMLDEAYFKDRFDVVALVLHLPEAPARRPVLAQERAPLRLHEAQGPGLPDRRPPRRLSRHGAPDPRERRACRSRPRSGPGTTRGPTTASPGRTTSGASRP